MFASLSVFLNFNLPNATTWCYFSFLLAVALFFKFSRSTSIRNWDVLFLFLLVPGVLLIQPEPEPAMRAAAVAGQLATATAGGGLPDMLGSLGMVPEGPDDVYSAVRWFWLGYLWLLCGSVYFFVRCLFDLALVQRPALAPNLTFGGMAWLAAALLGCLLAVAFRQPDRSQPMPIRIVADGMPSVSPPVGREGHVQEMAREWVHPSDWMRRGFAVLCHLAVILGLILVAHRHFHDATAGMAAATFYLTIPYTGIFISQVHHVWPIALIVWALAAYRMPTLSGAILGVAAGTAYFPALVFPLWLSFYWKRRGGPILPGVYRVAQALCLTALGVDLAIKGHLSTASKRYWRRIPGSRGRCRTREVSFGPACTGRIAFRCSWRTWRSSSPRRFGRPRRTSPRSSP